MCGDDIRYAIGLGAVPSYLREFLGSNAISFHCIQSRKSIKNSLVKIQQDRERPNQQQVLHAQLFRHCMVPVVSALLTSSNCYCQYADLTDGGVFCYLLLRTLLSNMVTI